MITLFCIHEKAKLNYIPGFCFVGSFYSLNVHADFVLDIGRYVAGVG